MPLDKPKLLLKSLEKDMAKLCNPRRLTLSGDIITHLGVKGHLAHQSTGYMVHTPTNRLDWHLPTVRQFLANIGAKSIELRLKCHRSIGTPSNSLISNTQPLNTGQDVANYFTKTRNTEVSPPESWHTCMSAKTWVRYLLSTTS